MYIDGVMKEVKTGMGEMGLRFLEEEKGWRLPGLLYADDLVLYGESEDDQKVMIGHFVEACKRRGLRVNTDNSKVMVSGGEEGSICVVIVDGTRSENVSPV